jgi:hypothetical protein
MGTSIEEGVEHAAAQLLPLVLERTGAEDAWYATFARAIAWYLEAIGLADDRLPQRIHAVVSGRFHSWTAPSDDDARATFAELATAATMSPPGTTRNVLKTWLDRRTTTVHLYAAVSTPVAGDGHERFITTVDRARDPLRAERMSAALVLGRDAARRGVPLTFDQLAECQAIVLGRPATLRTTEAFAKGGRERYPMLPDLHARFESCLVDAAGVGHPAIRAARVYLDVCFFHPFDDGNARAARLALDYVLTGAGLALHAAEPLFVVSRAGSDEQGLWALARAVQLLAGPA